MARFIPTDGQEQFVQPSSGRSFSLTELQFFVGGYIEAVSPARPHNGRELMFVNEEGRLLGMEENEKATQWAGQLIVGPVVICSRFEAGEGS